MTRRSCRSFPLAAATLLATAACTGSTPPVPPVPTTRGLVATAPTPATPAPVRDPFAPDSTIGGTTSRVCALRTSGDSTRFGDFVVNGLQGYNESWTKAARIGGPLSFTPRTPGHPGQPMTVTAVRVPTGTTVTASTALVSTSGDQRPFYVLAVDVPAAGTWQLHMRLGTNEGCALIEVQ